MVPRGVVYAFEVSGYEGDPYQMKSQARRAAKSLESSREIGYSGEIRFENYGKVIKRGLTKEEVTFGVKSPSDGRGGGFKGIAMWQGIASRVLVDLTRVGEEWVVDYVRQCIEKAGWTIVKEGDGL